MRLYHKLVEISSTQNMEVTWDVIQQFEPYITKECTDRLTYILDEDLKSEILTKLPHRILGFRVELE